MDTNPLLHHSQSAQWMSPNEGCVMLGIYLLVIWIFRE